LYPKESEKKQHIIVAGAGVFGSEIVESLQKTIPIVIVDHDPEVIANFSKRNIPAVYGERYDDSIWKKMGLENAKLFLVTIPDFKTALNLVKKARQQNKKAKIFCRAHYFSEALEFYENGADLVIMPQVIGSNYCLKAIADYLETGKLEKENHLQNEYLAYLKEKAIAEREIIGKIA
jgi:CPA2 family monovalent cation:H+ antiporter-2